MGHLYSWYLSPTNGGKALGLGEKSRGVGVAWGWGWWAWGDGGKKTGQEKKTFEENCMARGRHTTYVWTLRQLD